MADIDVTLYDGLNINVEMSAAGTPGVTPVKGVDYFTDDDIAEITGPINDDIDELKADLTEITTAASTDVGKALKAKSVTNGKVTEWEFGDAGKVNDVQINGESIVTNKTAKIVTATDEEWKKVAAELVKSEAGFSALLDLCILLPQAQNGEKINDQIEAETNILKNILLVLEGNIR